MKIYNLNIDTSKPTNQAMQMQQNETGLLNLNVTNGGKYIRNLTTKVYDGETEVPSTEKGFKIDVGTEPKHVKVVAESEPIMSEWEEIASYTASNRIRTFPLTRLQLPAGTYKVKELLHLANLVNSYQMWLCNEVEHVPTSNCARIVFNGQDSITRKIIPIAFLKYVDDEPIVMGPDEDIIVAEGNYFYVSWSIKASAIETTTTTYPAVGYYTDYQMDTTIKPSFNAPYDGEYTEPLEEIEVDGVKFVPTTLTIDGVEYKVLAEAQPAPDPEPETNDGE